MDLEKKITDALKVKIDVLNENMVEELRKLNQKFDNLESMVKELEGLNEELKNKPDNAEVILRNIEDLKDKMAKDLEGLNEELKNKPDNMVLQKEFVDLEKKITDALNENVATLDRKIVEKASKKDITGVNEAIVKVQTNIAKNTQAIKEVEKNLEQNTQNVTKNTNSLETVKKNVTKNTQDLTKNTKDVAKNKEQIKALEDKLKKELEEKASKTKIGTELEEETEELQLEELQLEEVRQLNPTQLRPKSASHGNYHRKAMEAGKKTNVGSYVGGDSLVSNKGLPSRFDRSGTGNRTIVKPDKVLPYQENYHQASNELHIKTYMMLGSNGVVYRHCHPKGNGQQHSMSFPRREKTQQNTQIVSLNFQPQPEDHEGQTNVKHSDPLYIPTSRVIDTPLKQNLKVHKVNATSNLNNHNSLPPVNPTTRMAKTFYNATTEPQTKVCVKDLSFQGDKAKVGEKTQITGWTKHNAEIKKGQKTGGNLIKGTTVKR